MATRFMDSGEATEPSHRSAIRSWISSREVAEQICPLVQKMENIALRHTTTTRNPVNQTVWIHWLWHQLAQVVDKRSFYTIVWVCGGGG